MAYVDSKPIKLNIKVRSINGCSMVPLRFISETFGAKLQYNGIDKIITINI